MGNSKESYPICQIHGHVEQNAVDINIFQTG